MQIVPQVLGSLTCARQGQSGLLAFNISDLHTQDAKLEKDKKESVWKQSQHMLKTRRLKIASHPREVMQCLEKDGR